MSVMLRLARHGAKKRPYYRLVAATKTASRDGRFIEHVGSYDPTLDPAGVFLKRDRVQHWLDQGAQPSPTVRRILLRHMQGEDTMHTGEKVERVEYVPPPAELAVVVPQPDPAAEAAPAEASAEEVATEEAAPEEEAAEEMAERVERLAAGRRTWRGPLPPATAFAWSPRSSDRTAPDSPTARRRFRPCFR